MKAAFGEGCLPSLDWNSVPVGVTGKGARVHMLQGQRATWGRGCLSAEGPQPWSLPPLRTAVEAKAIICSGDSETGTSLIALGPGGPVQVAWG